MKGFFQAIGAYFRAFGVLSKHNLWSYAILPGLVSMGIGFVIFSLLGYLGGDLLDAFFKWLCGIYPPSWPLHDGICQATEWLAGSWLGEILAWIISFLINLFMFRYIVMIVVGPFMGGLSEKVELKEKGVPTDPMTFKENVSSLVRALRVVLRLISREIFWVLVISLAGLLLPGIGSLVSAGLIFVVQAYYAGFGNVDPTLDRKRMSIKESVSYARENRGWITGNGIPFLLIILIPFLGWFMAPVLATTAATLTYADRQK